MLLRPWPITFRLDPWKNLTQLTFQQTNNKSKRWRLCPFQPKPLTKLHKINETEWENRTLSTGRVRKAVTIAATSSTRRVILKKEVQLKAIDNLRRQGLLHSSSSSWSSATAGFEEKQRGRKPTKVARFWVFSIFFCNPSFSRHSNGCISTFFWFVLFDYYWIFGDLGLAQNG